MLARDLGGRVGHNWEKYFVSLFHVSEHLDHFKAKQYFCEKKRKLFPVFFLKDSLISSYFPLNIES